MANNQVPRILIFSTAYLPLAGGAEIAVKEITDRIHDFDFDMITAKIKPGLADKEKIGQVNVHRVGFGSKNLDKFLLPIFGFFKAAKLNKQRNYNLIWSIMASQAGVGAVFLKIFYPAKKLLLTVQEGDPEEHLKRYILGINFLYKLLIRPWHILPFKKADYLTVISNDLKKRAKESGAKCPIKVVPNGVDVEKFKIQNSRRRQSGYGASATKFKIISQNLKSKLRINSDERVVITVSRLVKKNGVDDLIKAINQLSIKNEELRIKFLIIGTGSDEQKLKKLVDQLKLQDRVLFLGHIQHQYLPKYLAVADVFVRPSLSEGLGNVFLEAMAAGLPIIGTSVGGIPDFLKERETGLFCQVKNPQSIAEKIKEMLTNGQLRERIVKNARRLVEEEYNWHIIASKMEKIFLKLL